MVFPQGLFSREAVKALEASGYLAAVNTDLCPANQPQALALRDVLDVAVTRNLPTVATPLPASTLAMWRSLPSTFSSEKPALSG